MSPSGGLRGRRGSILAQLYSCTARRVVWPFLGGIRFVFGELDALTPPDCSGAMRPRGLWEGFFVKRRKRTHYPKNATVKAKPVQLPSYTIHHV